MIIFVTLHNGMRCALLAISYGSWKESRCARSDAEGNRENLLGMMALKERLPELTIVPAHDMRAFAKMVRLWRGVHEASGGVQRASVWARTAVAFARRLAGGRDSKARNEIVSLFQTLNRKVRKEMLYLGERLNDYGCGSEA